MRPEDLLARLEAGYEYDPMYGQLCNERDQLKAENAKLRTQLADVTESMGRVEERCAKLRELVRELWEGYADPPCEYCPLKDKPVCVDCPICAREAAVIGLMRELGVEADE